MDPDIQDLYAQRATLEVQDGVLYRHFLRARRPGSRRAAGRPARFDDFICSLTFERVSNMWQCSVCDSTFESESGLRRHMPNHRLRYHSGGRLDPMTDSEAQGVLQW